MTTMSMRQRVCAGLVLLVFVTATPIDAQGTFPPRSFQNLQVLPTDVSASDVISTMKGFTRALGVRCQFCHVGEEGLPLEKFDFAADTVPQKTIARNMMRMMREITKLVDAAKPPEPGTTAPRVTCYSCHRGQQKPLTDRG